MHERLNQWDFVMAALAIGVIGTVVLVGLLNYVPSLALGPVVEHLMLTAAR